LPVTAGITFGGTAYTRVIVAGTEYNADGLVEAVAYGDGGGPSSRVATQSTTTYDVRNRPTRMRTTREPLMGGVPGPLSGVTIAADQTLTWDAASNLTRIDDGRVAAEWPAGSKPQTILVQHDALYRVTNAHFDYTGTTSPDDLRDDWRTAMGTTREADPMRTQPAPMVGSTATAPTTRVRDLTWSYDWLGNMTEWGDDQSDFYERSIGDIRNGYGDGDHRPSALYFSANLGGLNPADRGGYVELDYGEGGNALSMTVHGDCVNRVSAMCDAPETPYGDPSGGSSSSARLAAARATCKCAVEQHYQYRWDELNRIAEARRYDRDGTLTTPTWSLKVRQRYRYDSANVRTVKQTLETIADSNSDQLDDVDGDPPERLTLYVYPGDFERRGLTRNVGKTAYIEADGRVAGVKVVGTAETQYVVGGARVVWEQTDAEPTRLDRTVTKVARVTIGIGDLIGTTGAVLDLESGELVEASTYLPNGARESYVRNSGGDDQAIAPEPMGFTGKEGDEEVGLTYFGERYLVSRIGRWASPDPLQIHAAGGGEVGNSYHYVSGNLLKGRDPIGLEAQVTVEPPQGGASSANAPVNLTVHLEIAVVHPDADTRAALSKYLQGAANMWNSRHFSQTVDGKTVNVSFDISIRIVGDEEAAEHLAVYPDNTQADNMATYNQLATALKTAVATVGAGRDGRSHARGGVMGVTPEALSRDPTGSGATADHEIGHLLGLDDQYRDHVVAGRTVSRTNLGHEGTLMGDHHHGRALTASEEGRIARLAIRATQAGQFGPGANDALSVEGPRLISGATGLPTHSVVYREVGRPRSHPMRLLRELQRIDGEIRQLRRRLGRSE